MSEPLNLTQLAKDFKEWHGGNASIVLAVDALLQADPTRYCDTHKSLMMWKDACELRMANSDRGGATNLGEQMDGVKDCVVSSVVVVPVEETP